MILLCAAGIRSNGLGSRVSALKRIPQIPSKPRVTQTKNNSSQSPQSLPAPTLKIARVVMLPSRVKGPFMASAAQLAANQANAQHSTGPSTAEGKARVSQNALRHGLTPRHLVIRDDEHEEFAVLQDSLSQQLDPQGAMETITFQELLHAAWSLHRFRRIEAEASRGTVEDFPDPATTPVLDRLSRYQARAQRAWQKALQELRVLQTHRALRARKLSEQEAAEVRAIASINDLTKQTHSEITAEALDLALQMIDYEAGAATLKARQERHGTTPAEPSLQPLVR